MAEQTKEAIDIEKARQSVIAAVKSLVDSEKRCRKFEDMFDQMKHGESIEKQKMTYAAFASVYGHLQLLYYANQKSMEFFMLVTETISKLREQNDIDALKSEIDALRSNALSVLSDIKSNMDKATAQQRKQNEEMHWFG